mmetsp:Transcript_3404/g.7040  ORF Transcript_3404/g.7040 Transcript_3404/m.7040 type:complete len:223 (-) Transcript_3404:92-760(-)
MNSVKQYMQFDYLEDTLSVSERRNVSRGILFRHCLAGDNLHDHISHNSHHRSAAVVQLRVQFARLLLGVLDIVSEPSHAVVAGVIRGGHPRQLDEREEKEDLEETGGGDGADAVDALRHVLELEVGGGGQVAVEVDAVVVDDAPDHGRHGDTAVLALDRTAAFEGFRFVVQPAEGVEDAEGGGGSELELVDHIEAAGGSLLCRRGEGGGRTGKNGGKEKLHG